MLILKSFSIQIIMANKPDCIPSSSLKHENTRQLSQEENSFRRFCHNSNLLIDEDEVSLDGKYPHDRNSHNETRKRHFHIQNTLHPNIIRKQRKVNDHFFTSYMRPMSSQVFGLQQHPVVALNRQPILPTTDQIYFEWITRFGSVNQRTYVNLPQAPPPQPSLPVLPMPQKPCLSPKTVGPSFRSHAKSMMIPQDNSKELLKPDVGNVNTRDTSCFDAEVPSLMVAQIQERILGVKWYKHYRALIEFKRCYGHCNVKRKGKEYEQLGFWVVSQRYQYKKLQEGKSSQMNVKRVEALEKIGFEWNPDRKMNDIWQQRYQELVEYKKLHGHCNISPKDSKFEGLLSWVSRQRYEQKKLYSGNRSRITPERIVALEKVGFEWNPNEKYNDLWQQRFEELLEFKQINGHCNVPQVYKPNKALGLWVHTQRTRYKKMKEGKLSPQNGERFQCLEKVGFQWSVTKY